MDTLLTVFGTNTDVLETVKVDPEESEQIRLLGSNDPFGNGCPLMVLFVRNIKTYRIHGPHTILGHNPPKNK